MEGSSVFDYPKEKIPFHPDEKDTRDELASPGAIHRGKPFSILPNKFFRFPP